MSGWLFRDQFSHQEWAGQNPKAICLQAAGIWKVRILETWEHMEVTFSATFTLNVSLAHEQRGGQETKNKQKVMVNWVRELELEILVIS